MELRTAITFLLNAEDTPETRESGRTHRALMSLLDTVLDNPDEDSNMYVYLAHSATFAEDCTIKFSNIIHQRVKRGVLQMPEGGRVSDKVFVGSRRVYFLHDDQELRGGKRFAGIYEDHFRFEQRLRQFLANYDR